MGRENFSLGFLVYAADFSTRSLSNLQLDFRLSITTCLHDARCFEDATYRRHDLNVLQITTLIKSVKTRTTKLIGLNTSTES